MASESAFHFDNADELSIGSRQVTIAVIPHMTAFLSILGSLFIIIDVLRDKKKSQKMCYHRLVLGMSISDLLASMFLFLSTWPIPSGTEGVFGAVGNLRTCVVQGFFIQLGLATVIYTAFLSIYYLLTMRYQWRDGDFRRLELFWHATTIVMTLGTAVASVFLGLYNNANLWCWIAPYPLDCLNSSKNDGVTTCERGDNAYIYRIAFYFIWLWLAVIVTTVCMISIFWTVWKQRQTMKKWDAETKLGKHASRRENSMVKSVAVQACLYIGAFFLTAIFPSLVRMFQAKWNCTSTFYPLTILTTTLFPLQGFWNFFIYVRPRFNEARRKNPDWSFYEAVGYTLGRTLSWKIPSSDNDYRLGLVKRAKISIQNTAPVSTTTRTTTTTSNPEPVPLEQADSTENYSEHANSPDYD